MRYHSYIRTAKVIGFIGLTLGLHAQQKVEGSGYNLLLKTLLSHSVPELSIKELEQGYQNYVLLDSREKKEYDVSHLKGAMNVGYDEFDINAVKGISKDQALVVYCSVGYRSEKIAEQLIAEGYSNVHNLYGGIFEWKNEGNEVYDANGKTEKIHVYSPTWGVWCKCDEKVSD